MEDPDLDYEGLFRAVLQDANLTCVINHPPGQRFTTLIQVVSFSLFAVFVTCGRGDTQEEARREAICEALTFFRELLPEI